jgi:hypothetical protein
MDALLDFVGEGDFGEAFVEDEDFGGARVDVSEFGDGGFAGGGGGWGGDAERVKPEAGLGGGREEVLD